MGPLEVSNVYEDSAVLDWKPPQDDGGLPIDHYEVESYDQQAGVWMPAGRAKDTNFKVENLQKGHLYKFRVKAVNKEGASDPLETETAIVAKNPYGG
jgi:predicted phage tail protein